jgi:predicted AlkP superfamily pyrophosphatase or phosphodiesterase
MKKVLVLMSTCLLAISAFSQRTDDRPKLVVGIVVDQMRNDYLFRFADLYGKGGFQRLTEEGFYAANHKFSYMPTTTAPGHASVYTGTTPAIHGIVGNNWYDPIANEKVYCVEDKSVKSVGVDRSSGQMSPKNLKTTTLTDELKLFWNDKSTVVGISLKDRGAVLPAGHLADGAYWYDDKRFISSSFYTDALPEWVNDFNNLHLVDTFLAKGWEPLLDKSLYLASLSDNNPYESLYEGEKYPVLPKDLVYLAEQNGADKVLKRSPWGNSLVFEFGIQAVMNEQMGKDEITDFLALSLSTPDYMGHAYGPRALEIQDMYLRLDNDLASFLSFLDDFVGKGNYTVMLTADHGAAEVPQFLMDEGLPGGYLNEAENFAKLEELMKDFHPYGLDLIEEVEGNHIYFNHEALRTSDIPVDELADYLAYEISRIPGIHAAYPSNDVRMAGTSEFPVKNLQRGLHPSLAGDVVFVPASGWINYGPTGTTHGSPWAYDSHVPLLLYGKGVEKGKTYRETFIRDVAPTLCLLMGVPFPSGMTGKPISEALSD